jgi:hypothetical protein
MAASGHVNAFSNGINVRENRMVNREWTICKKTCGDCGTYNDNMILFRLIDGA